MKNWKTTLAGVLVGGIALATYMGYLTEDQASMIAGALTALGFIVAKDHNVTGK